MLWKIGFWTSDQFVYKRSKTHNRRKERSSFTNKEKEPCTGFEYFMWFKHKRDKEAYLVECQTELSIVEAYRVLAAIHIYHSAPESFPKRKTYFHKPHPGKKKKKLLSASNNPSCQELLYIFSLICPLIINYLFQIMLIEKEKIMT